MSEFVTAPLKYLTNRDDSIAYIASVGGGDSTVHEGSYVMQAVPISDGRQRAGSFNLDGEGFCLLNSPSRVIDFYDDSKIAALYEKEIKELVAEATGCKRVEIFDHTRRAASLDTQRSRQIREPASIIHNDYTAKSGPQRLRDHFPNSPGEADRLLENRFCVVNVWRSIAGTVYNAPLALCDASTVDSKDLVSVERQARDRTGEIQQAVYNPAHQWYYFPHMTKDEVLLIKTYDAATDGRARFTLHTAFDVSAVDPDTLPEESRFRESIESRCFVFF